jgi:hypothetical protein
MAEVRKRVAPSMKLPPIKTNIAVKGSRKMQPLNNEYNDNRISHRINTEASN